MSKLVVFRGKNGWYYHLKSANNQVLLVSQRYYSKWNARRAAGKLSHANQMPVEVKNG